MLVLVPVRLVIHRMRMFVYKEIILLHNIALKQTRFRYAPAVCLALRYLVVLVH